MSILITCWDISWANWDIKYVLVDIGHCFAYLMTMQSSTPAIPTQPASNIICMEPLNSIILVERILFPQQYFKANNMSIFSCHSTLYNRPTMWPWVWPSVGPYQNALPSSSPSLFVETPPRCRGLPVSPRCRPPKNSKSLMTSVSPREGARGHGGSTSRTCSRCSRWTVS